MGKGIDYEKFTQEVYQSLIDAQGLGTIKVQHNIKIKGKSGQKHQIDVYWEYVIAGVKHCTAIECKNYNKEVSVGRVRDFYGVLSDIGNINGIIVSKEGFQKGALDYASHYGINVKEIREPRDVDWKGRIRSIEINPTMVLPHIKNRFISIDEEWVKKNIELPKDGDLSYSFGGLANEIWLVDNNGVRLKNFHQLDQELPINWKEEKDLKHNYKFDDAYIAVDKFGRLKIKEIQYLYDVTVTKMDSVTIKGDNPKAIIKDSLTGEIKFISKDGNIK
jgi:hypothetical protein